MTTTTITPRLLMGVAALWLLCSLPSHAEAQDDDLSFEMPLLGRTTFALTNTTIFRLRGDNYNLNGVDDDFASLYERVDMSLQADQVRLESRIDLFVPHTVFGESRCADMILDTNCYIDWDLRPERLTLRWEPAEWTIEVGDSQIVFGRGVALAFRKVDLLGIDNALRGGHVRYSGSNFRVGLHGGIVNPQNVDPIDLSIIREPEDFVVGANVGVTVPGSIPITVGGHALRVWFEDDDAAFRSRAIDVVGWSVEAPALADGQLAIYAEANALRRTQLLIDDPVQDVGRGVYASAQLQLDNLTVLLEWKDYTNFLVAPTTLEAQTHRIYSAAPPVEYNGPQRLRGIGNQRGGGIRMDYAFLPGPWAFSLNSALYGFNEEVVLDPWDGILASHSWLTITKRQEYGGDLNWALDIQAGARVEVLQHDIMPVCVPGLSCFRSGDLDRWMVHGRVDLTVGSGDHSLDIVVDHRHEREIRGDIAEFQIGGVSITYSYGVPLTLSLNLRWTDFQPGVVNSRGVRDYNFLGGEFYPSLEARYTFTPGTYLGLFVGQTPGGQLCSGGICRDVPTFEGFRLNFVGRL